MKKTSSVIIFAAAAMVAIAFAVPANAQVHDSWSVLPMGTRGVDPNDAATFKDLLQLELSARNSAAFTDIKTETICADVPCALAAGRAAKVDVVIYGNLSALGQKIVVTITALDVETGEVGSSQKITVEQIEDLEAAATRVATAILGGTTTEKTAELGTITTKEARPDLRREGESGLGLRLGGIAPFGAGSASGQAGIAFDFSYWYEASDFAIEPRFGLRTSTGDQAGSYFEMPIDVGAYYILGRGDFTPFFGGGAGLRFISETIPRTVRTGTVITSTNETEANDSGWGFSTFARAGIMLFRTYSLRLALTADYNLTLVEINDKSTAQSFTFGIGVMF